MGIVLTDEERAKFDAYQAEKNGDKVDNVPAVAEPSASQSGTTSDSYAEFQAWKNAQSGNNTANPDLFPGRHYTSPNEPATTVNAPATVAKDVPMIVAYTSYVDQNGVTQQKAHGPMPVAEWAEYERAHGM